ncbi:hypothetical protein QFW77_10920 [Luteimonas sp. RD2P54]|uniref:Uncharacterized protein n=1 Tax=Luteimonas endophytica TaxID=3042023 RepID=A0ABT6J9J9_9GAMM|nr:hypothetical protein [Luteimonas endophytica]MDH5823497.1 hypothetical protein [Luteimonas endophytica]
MSVPQTSLPNQAPPVTLEQLREALAFVTEQYDKIADSTTNVFVWLWEAIQGDFNEERTTGQIIFDTAISMIPGVDQVCDVRDIIANCKLINEDKTDTWAWVALCLTLIGLFPTLGSLVKGVLKIFFLFVRRSGGDAVVRAVEEAMTWVITFLRKREVQHYWKALKWDRLFLELANGVKAVRAQVSLAYLRRAFDRGIALMQNLVRYVKHVPFAGGRAEAAFGMVRGIRSEFDRYASRALRPVQDILDTIIRRLEIEDLYQRRGILDTGNIHFTGGLPEAQAVALMRRADPAPSWLSKGKPTKNKSLDPRTKGLRNKIDRAAGEGYPKLSDGEIRSFTVGMRQAELVGPMRLYRVVSPNNSAAGADWVTEDVWNQIMTAPDPKAAWRKHLAVWPDWNPDGQFVVYDLKPGERLKVWRGPAAAQVKEEVLPDHFLEGGWEQIKFPASGPNGGLGDAGGYYRRSADGRLTQADDMDRTRYHGLSSEEQAQYQFLREKIEHPSILGPFDTGWGYTDFDAQMIDARLGLPSLPGQVTNL